MKKPHIHLSDLRGLSRLLVDATVGITNMVETAHKNYTANRGETSPLPTGARTAELIYETIRGMTRIVGDGIETSLAQLPEQLDHIESSDEREAVVSALNGIFGDHIENSNNPLAIAIGLRRAGRRLELDRDALAAAIPEANGKLLVLVHGHCMSDVQWLRHGHSHGAALAAAHGYTDIYLCYPTGLHISSNGRAFAQLLEELIAAWPTPVDELVLLGYSMGGLMVRSACHYGAQAGHRWPTHLRKLVTLGTPHHGAPLERGGNWLEAILDANPHTMPYTQLTKTRSPGSTDLRYGNILDEDWADKDRFALLPDQRRPTPLPDGVDCYAIGGVIAENTEDFGGKFIGDGLVSLQSALGQHSDPAKCLAFAASRQKTVNGVNHLDLLDNPEISAQLLTWLGPQAS